MIERCTLPRPLVTLQATRPLAIEGAKDGLRVFGVRFEGAEQRPFATSLTRDFKTFDALVLPSNDRAAALGALGELLLVRERGRPLTLVQRKKTLGVLGKSAPIWAHAFGAERIALAQDPEDDGRCELALEPWPATERPAAPREDDVWCRAGKGMPALGPGPEGALYFARPDADACTHRLDACNVSGAPGDCVSLWRWRETDAAPARLAPRLPMFAFGGSATGALLVSVRGETSGCGRADPRPVESRAPGLPGDFVYPCLPAAEEDLALLDLTREKLLRFG
ncbi:MAG TPA: hypothetical protein VFV94_00195, partial [Polyangiaceae bacterium]|nr:hypothetical protein [Polyangiaceae bacterium]